MPRVLVVTEGPDREVIMSEHVVPDQLDTEFARHQLVERLSWGIDDAVKLERQVAGSRRTATSYLDVGA